MTMQEGRLGIVGLWPQYRLPALQFVGSRVWILSWFALNNHGSKVCYLITPKQLRNWEITKPSDSHFCICRCLVFCLNPRQVFDGGGLKCSQETCTFQTAILVLLHMPTMHNKYRLHRQPTIQSLHLGTLNWNNNLSWVHIRPRL